MRLPRLVLAIPIWAAIFLVGCATVPQPTDAIGDAEHALERAQSANAQEFAAFEYAQAQRKLERARKLGQSNDEDDWLKARRLATQAAVDGRLAEEQARLAKARSTHQELQNSVQGTDTGGPGQ